MKKPCHLWDKEHEERHLTRCALVFLQSNLTRRRSRLAQTEVERWVHSNGLGLRCCWPMQSLSVILHYTRDRKAHPIPYCSESSSSGRYLDGLAFSIRYFHQDKVPGFERHSYGLHCFVWESVIVKVIASNTGT